MKFDIRLWLKPGEWAVFLDKDSKTRTMKVLRVLPSRIKVMLPVKNSKGRYPRRIVPVDRVIGRYDRRRKTTFYFRKKDAKRYGGELAIRPPTILH